MKTYTLLRSFIIIGLSGMFVLAHAADGAGRTKVELPYDILGPSTDLAIHIQKQGDYATAALLYEVILKQDPTNLQILRRMVQCHEALAKEERKEKSEVTQKPRMKEDDSLTDLPNLISADDKNAQQPLSNPKNSLL